MAKINWATLVRSNVIGNGIAVAGQDRTGTRLVAGLLPPALLSGGHRSMPAMEPAAESYSPASDSDARVLRAGRSGRFAGSLDSRSLAAVASQTAQRERFAGSPVVTASAVRRPTGAWCLDTDAKRTATTMKPADRQMPRSAHRKPTLSLRGWR